MPRRLPPASSRPRIIFLVVAAVLLLIFGRSICSLVIDYMWWREMAQVPTWLRMSAYGYLTGIAEWLIIFVVVWWAHARGMKYAGTGLREQPRYARLSTVLLAFLSLILAALSMDGWTVARYVAGSGVPSAWHDPVFGKPLSFYFFDLPFYTSFVGFLEMLAAVGALAYYLAARGWQIKLKFSAIPSHLEWEDLRALGKLETGMLHVMIAGFLIALAVTFW